MKNLHQIHEEREVEFDDEFAVVKDINRTMPDEWSYLHTKDIVQSPEPDDIKSHNKETTLALIDGMIEWLEGEKRDTNPKQADGSHKHQGTDEWMAKRAYNVALDTTISHLKVQRDLIDKGK